MTGLLLMPIESPFPNAAPIEVTVPVVLEVPAPIRDLISAADIFVFNDGAEPLDKTAGVPVSDTFALFVVMFDA